MEMLWLVAWLASWIGIGIYLFRWSKNTAATQLSAWFMGVAGGFVGSMILAAALSIVVGIWSWFTAPPPPPTAEEACSSDWHKCADNAMLVNHLNDMYVVTQACERYAKDQARYGEPRFSDTPFPTYETGKAYVNTGMVLLKDNGAEFQNGFGAWEHLQLQCLYDLNDRKVVDFSATPRQ